MKKILIYSTSYDPSTNHVMDWISYLGHSPTRLNTVIDNKFPDHYISNLDDIEAEDSMSYDITKNDFDAVWFRKLELEFLNEKIINLTEDSAINKIVKSHLHEEYFKSLDSIVINFGDKILLGKKFNEKVCKLSNLIEAKKIGIDIPKTLITNKKERLLQFKEECTSIVSKPLGEVSYFQDKSKEIPDLLLMYTEVVDDAIIYELPDAFFPSLFQEKLEKELELRVFYLNGECYAMAIFSQLDDQTKTDFRMYNKKKNNRNVPYKLTPSLKDRICKLMTNLGYKTGSLDFIKTTEGKYVFLEVNPYGQYGMISSPCNFHLDQKIANYLTK